MNVIYEFIRVLTSQHVLAAAFKPHQDAMIAASKITEVGADYYIIEIAPESAESSGTAYTDASTRRIAKIYRLNISGREMSGPGEKTMKGYALRGNTYGCRTIIQSEKSGDSHDCAEKVEFIGIVKHGDYSDDEKQEATVCDAQC